jgi:hypothetical protein
MSDNSDYSIVPLGSHELTVPNRAQNRIINEMVESSLVLARDASSTDSRVVAGEGIEDAVTVSRIIPARDYFAHHYATDFALFGRKGLCGKTLSRVMCQPERGAFHGFAEFVLCQFALNMHNQEFCDHSPHLHSSWREYSAPFAKVGRCHRMSHNPDSILRFVQSPPQGFRLPRVDYDWAEVTDFIRFFFGDYLAGFARSLVESEFASERYIAAVATDLDCRATILTPNGWESRNVTRLLSTKT